MGDHDFKKMLDMCIYDYLIRKKLRITAEIFADEADVSPNKVAMAPPEGLLNEWWSIFWDVYYAQLQHVAPDTTKSSTTADITLDLISQQSENIAIANSVTYTAEQNLYPISSVPSSVSSADLSAQMGCCGNLQTNISVQWPLSVTMDDGQDSMMVELKSQSSNLARQESEIIKQHESKPALIVSRERAKPTTSIRNKKRR